MIAPLLLGLPEQRISSVSAVINKQLNELKNLYTHALETPLSGVGSFQVESKIT